MLSSMRHVQYVVLDVCDLHKILIETVVQTVECGRTFILLYLLNICYFRET